MGLDIQDIIGSKRGEVIALAEQHGVSNIRVFGSLARNEAHSDSDIDFLVDLHDGTTMWDLVALWQDLETLLDCSVNVVAEDDQNDRFMQSARKDAIPL
jgi:uncharacterized protein